MLNLAQIIADAEGDGVHLYLTATGTINATGEKSRIAHWAPSIRENKAGFVALLSRYPDAAESEPAKNDNLRVFAWTIHFAGRDPVFVSFSPEATRGEVLAAYPGAVAAEPSPKAGKPPIPELLTAAEESALQKWLAQIGETDEPPIAEILRECRSDGDAREYFLTRAGVLRSNDPGDDRIRCTECRNYTYSGICSVARSGGKVSAMKGYRPAGPEMLQRCDCYEAKGSTND
jgi:hypothetical protein